MKLSLLLILTTLLSLNLQAREIEGNITLGDGRRVVRIDIGREDQNIKQMARRIRRLESAVHDLQNVVYDLQTQVPQESHYSCTARTCRESTSIHSTSGTNCSFFNMYRTEKISVWATSGSEAETSAEEKLKADKDIAKIGSSVSCIKLED